MNIVDIKIEEKENKKINKPILTFIIINPSKDFILWNYYIYLCILNIITNKKQLVIV